VYIPCVVALEEDRAWLEAFRRGERDALARVFDAYGPDIARTIRAGVLVKTADGPLRVGNGLLESDIEALVHDTFVKAFAEKARHSYDGIRPYGAWLATIARNTLLDHGRALQTRRVAHVEMDELAAAGPTQEDVVHTHELRGLLGRFLGALDDLDRNVFRLRFAEARSRRDAGHELGLSEMQVRRRDIRLKRDLVNFLHNHGAPVPKPPADEVS
jgi:RNA polymerase sigma-70 factor, ECF subfamily